MAMPSQPHQESSKAGEWQRALRVFDEMEGKITPNAQTCPGISCLSIVTVDEWKKELLKIQAGKF